MPIKISKPERLPKHGVSETDLFAWWNELMNYLRHYEGNFKVFREKGWYEIALAVIDLAREKNLFLKMVDLQDKNGNIFH